MAGRILNFLRDYVPGFGRIERLPRQLLGGSPFAGEIQPTRVRLRWPRKGGPVLPFPHPWNYHEPIKILEAYYFEPSYGAGGKHNRYLEVPGFAPVLVTRDPRLIRAITTDSGDKPGQFDRDTMPSTGIARATGKDTLLYSNGAQWRRQKKLSTPPFARTNLFQVEQFQEFEDSFRQTVRQRLDAMHKRLQQEASTRQPGKGPGSLRIALEPEIKAVLLELLCNIFFGAEIPYAQIRERFVPALEVVIDHIVRDTVMNKVGIPLRTLPGFSRRIRAAKAGAADYEKLTDLVIATRQEGKGLWKQFKSDAPDEALRSNIKAFLAGALEATTSYASWAIAHLARNPSAQQKLFEEVKDIDQYTPQSLESAKYLGQVLDETLRLTPALYFFPRQATADTWVDAGDGKRLWMPKGTHILLDIWHANRDEDHWGVAVSGYPAGEFVPERWERATKEFLHFGFGHGPRFCPGKALGQVEVALVVGTFVKLFEFTAVNRENPVRAGVSTKPADGVLVDLKLREPHSVASERVMETV